MTSSLNTFKTVFDFHACSVQLIRLSGVQSVTWQQDTVSGFGNDHVWQVAGCVDTGRSCRIQRAATLCCFSIALLYKGSQRGIMFGHSMSTSHDELPKPFLKNEVWKHSSVIYVLSFTAGLLHTHPDYMFTGSYFPSFLLSNLLWYGFSRNDVWGRWL